MQPVRQRLTHLIYIFKKKRSGTQDRKLFNLFLGHLGLICTVLGGLTVYTLGSPEEDENGQIVSDEYTHRPIFQQYFLRTFRDVGFYRQFLYPFFEEKYLPDPLPYPYAQPEYTLVLELTDVLVHPVWSYNAGWKFKKRPLLDYFLETLSGSFEIVIFTLEPGGTAYPLIDVLDPQHKISYRLVRDATHYSNGKSVKSMKNLNRDPSKIIYIDWNADNVEEQENLFHIKKWTGNDDDTSLFDLVSLLKAIADNKIPDVRLVLKSYSKYEDPIDAFRQKTKKLIDELEAQAAAMKNGGNLEHKNEWSRKLFRGKK